MKETLWFGLDISLISNFPCTCTTNPLPWRGHYGLILNLPCTWATKTLSCCSNSHTRWCHDLSEIQALICCWDHPWEHLFVAETIIGSTYLLLRPSLRALICHWGHPWKHWFVAEAIIGSTVMLPRPSLGALICHWGHPWKHWFDTQAILGSTDLLLKRVGLVRCYKLNGWELYGKLVFNIMSVTK